MGTEEEQAGLREALQKRGFRHAGRQENGDAEVGGPVPWLLVDVPPQDPTPLSRAEAATRHPLTLQQPPCLVSPCSPSPCVAQVPKGRGLESLPPSLPGVPLGRAEGGGTGRSLLALKLPVLCHPVGLAAPLGILRGGTSPKVPQNNCRHWGALPAGDKPAGRGPCALPSPQLGSLLLT